MINNDEWREDQKDLTRDILQRRDPVAFLFDISGINKGCTFNHLDGRYGYITLKDALADNYKLFDYETDEFLDSYDSIEDLIDGGWKVST